MNSDSWGGNDKLNTRTDADRWAKAPQQPAKTSWRPPRATRRCQICRAALNEKTRARGYCYACVEVGGLADEAGLWKPKQTIEERMRLAIEARKRRPKDEG